MNTVEKISTTIEEKKASFQALHDKVWALAELGFQEHESAGHIIEMLKGEGFTVETGLADIPTAFVASYGSGHPVVAILGEYDALPGLSQQAGCPVKKPLEEGGCGHGCGHSLLGTASAAAAVAVKDWLAEGGLKGTIRYYGCPGEEIGCGKVFMARDGIFDDVDAALTWHPSDSNTLWGIASNAVLSLYFTFTGRTAHAASAPHLGRSALDACELMGVGANYLREHIIPEARVHYAYVDAGGISPNVVQDRATVDYMIRAPRLDTVFEIVERIKDVARGAALMTGTQLSYSIKEGLCDYVPNQVLGQVLCDAFDQIGAPAFDADDIALAKQFQGTLTQAEIDFPLKQLSTALSSQDIAVSVEKGLCIGTPRMYHNPSYVMPASTDVGDVSYKVPTAQITVATAALGSVPHTWQYTAQTASSIGYKGMICASKTLGLAAARLFETPSICQQAQEEHRRSVPSGYICPIPADMKPLV